MIPFQLGLHCALPACIYFRVTEITSWGAKTNTFSAGSAVGVLSNASSLTDLRKLREGLPLPCFNGFRFCTSQLMAVMITLIFNIKHPTHDRQALPQTGVQQVQMYTAATTLGGSVQAKRPFTS